MHFAYTRHKSALGEQLIDWSRRLATAGCTVHALLDGCMLDSRELERLARLAIDFHPALAGSAFDGYGSQGPLLWTLDTSNTTGLNALLSRTDGIPGLSFIAARPSRAPLTQKLIWLASCRTEDDQHLHCRFADTRMLPSLLDCLKAEQRAVLAETIAEWAWIARDATWRAYAFVPAGEKPEPTEQSSFRLDAKQFAGMLTQAEPDMVFQMLVENMPDLIPDLPAHDMHTRLVCLLDAARGHGVADLPDLFQYAVVGLSTIDRFDQHPALQETWQRLKRGEGRFGELAEQWPQEVWQDLHRAANLSHESKSLE